MKKDVRLSIFFVNRMGLKQYIKRGLKYVVYGTHPVDVRADIHYLNPDKVLVGKRIIVTGGGRGLGFAMAHKFVAEGAKVLICGRNEEVLVKSASELGCEYLSLDMRCFDTFDQFVQEASNKLGGIDCLVNNAGISLHEATFFDVTAESFDAQVKTNFEGPFFLAQKVARYMLDNGTKGSLLFISSETGDTADIRPYGLIKASINSLVRGLAFLFVKSGIRVNAIAPGITASDMTGVNPNGNLSLPFTASGRAYLPEEIAEAAAFMLSDASGCISGQILVCNNANTVNARWK